MSRGDHREEESRKIAQHMEGDRERAEQEEENIYRGKLTRDKSKE